MNEHAHNGIPPVCLELDTNDSAIRTVRAEMTRWLRAIGASPADALALQHATVELVTNSVEHGHPDGTIGTVVVDTELTDDRIAKVTVLDDGTWQEPSPERTHRGLALARSLVDTVETCRTPIGTLATIEHRLSGSPAERPAPVETATDLVITDRTNGTQPSVAVGGPVDATTAPRFAEELRRRTAGGTHKLGVDLTAVTHLAAAGLAVLHDNPAITPHAPANTPAAQILNH